MCNNLRKRTAIKHRESSFIQRLVVQSFFMLFIMNISVFKRLRKLMPWRQTDEQNGFGYAAVCYTVINSDLRGTTVRSIGSGHSQSMSISGSLFSVVSCFESAGVALVGLLGSVSVDSGLSPLTGPFSVFSSFGSSTLGLGFDTTGLQDEKSS